VLQVPENPPEVWMLLQQSVVHFHSTTFATARHDPAFGSGIHSYLPHILQMAGRPSHR
jgi:hypothetical protein